MVTDENLVLSNTDGVENFGYKLFTISQSLTFDVRVVEDVVVLTCHLLITPAGVISTKRVLNGIAR